MATNYFAPIQQIRADANRTRLSALADSLGQKQRTALSVLSDPRYTSESRRAFAGGEKRGILSELQTVSEVENARQLQTQQAEVAQKQEDAKLFRDVIGSAMNADGTIDYARLQSSFNKVPPSHIKDFETALKIYQPPKVERDPVNDYIRKAEALIELKKKHGVSLSGGRNAGERGEPSYSPAAQAKAGEVMQRMNRNTDLLAWNKESGYVTPEQAKRDSIFSEMSADTSLVQGFKDLQAGKNTWQAQAAQEVLDADTALQMDILSDPDILKELESGD